MRSLAILPLILFILAAGFFAWKLTVTPEAKPDPAIGRMASEPVLSPINEETPVAKPLAQLRDKYVMVNFFASWCVPCLAEHSLLKTLGNDHAVTLYGVAWNDDSSAVTAWLNENGNPYDLLGLDVAGKTGVEYGITGVPESFLVDPEGKIIWHISGPLTEEIVRQQVIPLLP